MLTATPQTLKCRKMTVRNIVNTTNRQHGNISGHVSPQSLSDLSYNSPDSSDFIISEKQEI